MAHTRDLGDMYGFFIAADTGAPTYQVECVFCGKLKLVSNTQAWLFCGDQCHDAFKAVRMLRLPARRRVATRRP